MSWLEIILGKVAWWVKGLIMIASSIICTMLPSPIPIADISFIANLQAFNNFWWYVIVILVITTTDTIFAIITYFLGTKLTNRFIKTEKAKKKLDKIKTTLLNGNKDMRWRLLQLNAGVLRVRFGRVNWADVWVFLASATPLPFTFTIYATAVLDYKMKKFVPIIFIGRLVKYIWVAIAFYLGYNLIGG